MSTIPLNLQTDAVELPAPSLSPSIALEQALKKRRSWRSFLPDPLSLKLLSAMLWAGFGMNRPETGGRTAPSAHNWQEIDVYAVLPEGAFRYEPRGHRLALVKAEDLRKDTGTQDFVATAPLNLVYVANFSRMPDARPAEREFLAGADAGCIAQNVYLFCACVGLATVVRGLIDRQRLSAALGLGPTERVALAQSVGRAGAA
ncbi:MAG: SagB/ThcOx family dehydrogenase [Burkholderiaceae bacterium]|nr:SagB/ThcOx family dehydrogenase [Burkholderiaceae bacterium]